VSGAVSEASSIPRHVAIVMDGNGRWAKKRYMPRVFGHKQGMDTLIGVIDACIERGIEYLTVYAFSSENWKRPEEEVSGLMSLVLTGVGKYLTKIAADGVRVFIAGDRAAVSEKVCAAWDQTEAATANNRKLTLTICFNYGGRWDIVQACREAVRQGCGPEDITEEKLSSLMVMRHAPDPDLFIRTGGEVRISNFLLWQVAYSEFYFTDCLWPDFDAAQLDAALKSYATRERRFGGVLSEPTAAPAGQGA
jgi:undecaprenyl diphosphate synthase